MMREFRGYGSGEEFIVNIPEKTRPITDLKLPRIIKRTEEGLVDAYIIENDDIMDTYMPWVVQPLTDYMYYYGFMNDQGKVHWEFNQHNFVPQQYMNFRALLKPRLFYEKLVQKFLESSLIRGEKRLIAGGHVLFNFRTKEAHLLNLVILPRRLLPDVDPEIRQHAVFIFQEIFDFCVARIGGVSARTESLTIPDKKMRALGWAPVKIKGFKKRWELFRKWWPISLRGLQRPYEKHFDDLGRSIPPIEEWRHEIKNISNIK